ncbi:MAG TPA: DUF2877 domain-containing protein [Nocardioidaceae bacterium]|nr:DUF2877 domain-containing protein [Nocardioidaceae bacterium]
MPVARDIPREVSGAASALLVPLLTAGSRRLTLVAATRVSRHYRTEDPRCPTVSVLTPTAIRLPDSVVLEASATLPDGDLATGSLVGNGDTLPWLRVTRWWRPARPSRLAPPPDLGAVARTEWRVRVSGVPALHDLGESRGIDPDALVGAGPGLTPAGDDVLAGALVTARATDDPRLPLWRDRTRRAMDLHRTTVVSYGLLTHALHGYAVPPLADFLTALCTPDEPPDRVEVALDRLMAVGHSSGSALATGILHTLATREVVAAA